MSLPATPVPKFDTFYKYDALTRLLFDYAESNPHIVSLQSIGKSFEGRDIWVLTLTNAATGKTMCLPKSCTRAHVPCSCALIEVIPPTGNIPVFNAISRAKRATSTSGNASSVEVPPEKSRSAQRPRHPAARTPSGTAISHEISSAGTLNNKVFRARGQSSVDAGVL